MKAKLFRLLRLLEVPGALSAAFRWRKFSLAAYEIVGRLGHAGVMPATVIDVGANEGQFSTAAAMRFPSADIYPIEPDKKTAVLLRKNLPSRVAQNILVTAVGERNGNVTFHVNADSQVSSILVLGEDRKAFFPDSKVVETIEIPLATLDTLFQQKKLVPPVLLKIDVQGYEDRVIAGAQATLSQVDWVMMEVSFAELYEGESSFRSILALMDRVGFDFMRPLNYHMSEITGEIIEMDALFANRALVEINKGEPSI